jgi:hypothetical protein
VVRGTPLRCADLLWLASAGVLGRCCRMTRGVMLQLLTTTGRMVAVQQRRLEPTSTARGGRGRARSCCRPFARLLQLLQGQQTARLMMVAAKGRMMRMGAEAWPLLLPLFLLGASRLRRRKRPKRSSTRPRLQATLLPSRSGSRRSANARLHGPPLPVPCCSNQQTSGTRLRATSTTTSGSVRGACCVLLEFFGSWCVHFQAPNTPSFLSLTTGICVARKAVRLYADFYDSDIIVASPLALRRLIGGGGAAGATAAGDEAEGGQAAAAAPSVGRRSGDADFLSSIEVVIIDAADVLLMQVRRGMDCVFEVEPSRCANMTQRLCRIAFLLRRTGSTSETSSQRSTYNLSRCVCVHHHVRI